MNKNELVAAIAELADLSKTKTTEVLEAFIEVVEKTLASGGDIRLVGFGTFEVAHRKATDGRNPRTGAVIKIPASKQPKFRPGKQLKEKVNKPSKKKAA
ncbi:MAG: HU family DNA-binding protein [Pseudomonadota bacterium]